MDCLFIIYAVIVFAIAIVTDSILLSAIAIIVVYAAIQYLNDPQEHTEFSKMDNISI